MIRAAQVVTLVLVTLGVRPAARALDRAPVCVAGPGAAVLVQALVIEGRMQGRPVSLVVVAAEAECPAGALRLVADGDAPVVVGADGARTVEAGPGLDPADRAREAARRVLALADTEAARVAASAPLVDPGMRFPSVRVEAAPEPAPAGIPVQPQGYVAAAGGYLWQSGSGLHLGWTGLEAGAALYGERLAVGLGGEWQPPADAGREVPASSEAGCVAVVVRGGERFRPGLLRAGVGAGAEWRTVTVRPQTRLDEARAGAATAIVLADLEWVTFLGDAFRLGLGGGARWYAGGRSYAWQGKQAWARPTWAAGVTARVLAVF